MIHYVLLSKGSLEFEKKRRILYDFPRYSIHVQKRVVMATVGLHKFIKISKFLDADFAEVMIEPENKQH